VKIISEKDDARPAVVLNDVQAADFSHLEIPHSAGIPGFVLHNVVGFSVSRTKGVRDVTLDKVADKEI
jgi:hypothetical protein